MYSTIGNYNNAIENLHLSIGMNPKDGTEAIQVGVTCSLTGIDLT